MHALTVLANVLKDPDLWYPTILGVLVVISAVALFCGGPYLLLATNMGSRLGFLVASAALSGLMILMALLWLTNPSPVNTLKGRLPGWVAVEAIDNGDVAQSKVGAVATIDSGGRKANDDEATNLRASLDTTLVLTKNELTGEIESAAGGEYAVYEDATEYLVTKNQVTGGGGIFSQFEMTTGGGFPWIHVSLHKPLYGVVTTCKVDPALSATEVPYGQKPPVPKCQDDTRQVLVFVKDLGSLRAPPFVTLIASSLLFGLSLLCLHWRELDLAAQANATAGTPIPEPV